MELDWPSAVRGPLRQAEAREFRDSLLEDGTPADHAQALAEAYRLAAYVAECELSDGRGGEELHEAAQAFCSALERHS